VQLAEIESVLALGWSSAWVLQKVGVSAGNSIIERLQRKLNTGQLYVFRIHVVKRYSSGWRTFSLWSAGRSVLI